MLRWQQFMQNACIPKFDPNLVPDVRVRVDYNDDLYLGSFEKSNKIWADTQKQGVTPEITGRPSYPDRVTQALTAEFPLTKEIPTPPEIITLAEWISSNPQGAILSFWNAQYTAIQQLVRDAAPTQAAWKDLTPQAIRPETEKFQATAFHQLLRHFNLGGDRWIGQFVTCTRIPHFGNS